MIDLPFTHYAFSDDSKHKNGRYHSLSLVTVSKQHYKDLLPELQNILKESGVKTEFKWHRCNGKKSSFAAEKMIKFVFQHQSKIKIDNIIWDYEDSRHKNVFGMDKPENLIRMYYHLFMSTTSKKWPIKNVLWKWMPDEQASVDWDTLRICIRTKKHPAKDLFHPDETLYRFVELREISASKSEKHPFIQIADLFAGISACSYGEYDRIKEWESSLSQLNLFLQEDIGYPTRTQEARFPLIVTLNKMCKEQKLGISFSSRRGLYSPAYRSHNFLNFWLYTPQSKYDQAPKKTRSRYLI